jgi:hypothetical protein
MEVKPVANETIPSSTPAAAEPKEPTKAAKVVSSSSALVPASPENIEFGAGVVGGIAGLVVGGPLLAVILSLAANYGSKQKNDVGDAVRGLSSTAINTFNWLSSLNAKYDVTGQASSALGDAVDKLKQTDDTKALDKVETSLKDATAKVRNASVGRDCTQH